MAVQPYSAPRSRPRRKGLCSKPVRMSPRAKIAIASVVQVCFMHAACASTAIAMPRTCQIFPPWLLDARVRNLTWETCKSHPLPYASQLQLRMSGTSAGCRSARCGRLAPHLWPRPAGTAAPAWFCRSPSRRTPPQTWLRAMAATTAPRKAHDGSRSRCALQAKQQVGLLQAVSYSCAGRTTTCRLLDQSRKKNHSQRGQQNTKKQNPPNHNIH